MLMEDNIISGGGGVATSGPSSTSSTTTTTTTTPQSQSPTTTTTKKIRIIVRYQQVEQFISWYGTSIPAQTIENAIRTVFNLSANARLFLKDEDDDVVAIAPTLPPGVTFNLYVVSEDMNNFNNNNGPALGSQVVQASSSLSTNNDQSIKQSLIENDVTSDVAEQVGTISNIVVAQSDNGASSESRPSSNKRDLETADQSVASTEDDDEEARKKRRRRKAIEIDRSFKCSMANCQKVYGSENALKMHIKLKHPEYQYLILQQPIPLHQKPPSIVVNNKMLSNSNNTASSSTSTSGSPSSSSPNSTPTYQVHSFSAAASTNQSSTQQQNGYAPRIATSLLVTPRVGSTSSNNEAHHHQHQYSSQSQPTFHSSTNKDIFLVSKQSTTPSQAFAGSIIKQQLLNKQHQHQLHEQFFDMLGSSGSSSGGSSNGGSKTPSPKGRSPASSPPPSYSSPSPSPSGVMDHQEKMNKEYLSSLSRLGGSQQQQFSNNNSSGNSRRTTLPPPHYYMDGEKGELSSGMHNNNSLHNINQHYARLHQLPSSNIINNNNMMMMGSSNNSSQYSNNVGSNAKGHLSFLVSDTNDTLLSSSSNNCIKSNQMSSSSSHSNTAQR
ncbi:hypothetical protein SAMD00019534_046130 [Acytostelium subglobosum LB1]|uniref:hypothetical protein n=1 Tax=Acytostelium subglobosum LB1 TaxID=1410327 RepID=UPI00064502BF|nr:hypothetical protein SAMD00019534_046130 [Acytostelium subglobosum LB1]GAM21438.1 hypothetical protein SAMD00019534_046130 [Acytostelium subglobosum LB1]|eukprot:XP_012755557.1 hypothetical protein SAMD00019534_046130 [Acytostelium subglobosum LB1]